MKAKYDTGCLTAYVCVVEEGVFIFIIAAHIEIIIHIFHNEII